MKRRGVTYIESLVASIILGVGVVAIVAMAAAVFQMTRSVDNSGVAYSLSRKTVEDVRAAGFALVSEGTVTSYYDAYGVLTGFTRSSNDMYKVVRTVTTDEFFTNQAGQQVPADYAMRTVVVQVYRTKDNNLLMTTGTTLVRGGI